MANMSEANLTHAGGVLLTRNDPRAGTPYLPDGDKGVAAGGTDERTQPVPRGTGASNEDGLRQLTPHVPDLIDSDDDSDSIPDLIDSDDDSDSDDDDLDDEEDQTLVRIKAWCSAESSVSAFQKLIEEKRAGARWKRIWDLKKPLVAEIWERIEPDRHDKDLDDDDEI